MRTYTFLVIICAVVLLMSCTTTFHTMDSVHLEFTDGTSIDFASCEFGVDRSSNTVYVVEGSGRTGTAHVYSLSSISVMQYTYAEN